MAIVCAGHRSMSGIPMALALLGSGGSVVERLSKLEKRVDSAQDAVSDAKVSHWLSVSLREGTC